MALHLSLFCMLSIGFLAGGISIFAFSYPRAFVRWASPVYWLSRKIFSRSKETELQLFDRLVAIVLGSFSLFLASLVCFVLGAWFTMAFFGFWGSPLSRWMGP